MDIVNCHVALGGDAGNTVPKYGITVAEAAVLRGVHGAEGIREVEVVGQADVNPRAELARLRNKYRARNDDGDFIVDEIYPGANARVHETIEELGLVDELMKTDRKPVAKVKKKIEIDLFE